MPKTKVVIAVTRERRVQLEYTLQTALTGAFMTRERNGSKLELPNKSVIIVQVSGPQVPDVDVTKMKGRPWKAWITDAEEAKDAKK